MAEKSDKTRDISLESMKFYSIVYPTEEQETRSKSHTWLIQSRRGANIKKEYVVRGNKLVLADPCENSTTPPAPLLYIDTNFCQVIDAICQGPDAETIKALYYSFCCDEDMLAYRHEVFTALLSAPSCELIRRFCQLIKDAQSALLSAEQAVHPAQRDRYIIDALYAYGNALLELSAANLPPMDTSRGLLAFVETIRRQSAEIKFIQTFSEVKEIRREIERIEVQISAQSESVTVGFEPPMEDYIERLNQTLQAQNIWNVQADAKAIEIRLFRQPGMNLFETQVLEQIIGHRPQVFERMHRAAARVDKLIPDYIARFTREVRFYFMFIDFMNSCDKVPFVLPQISSDDSIDLRGVADLALALTGADVTPNDFILSPSERGAIVTGANQGGKTTFARALGQTVIMTMLGLPVPCAYAALPLYAQAYTIFNEAEDSTIDNGKLKEELIRLKPILAGADSGSFIIQNEMFSSTTAQDALKLTIEVLDRLTELQARILCVTHIHGVRNLRPSIVGLSTEAPDADGKRNYRIIRNPSDQSAYARDIALKHQLTAESIRRRLRHDY